MVVSLLLDLLAVLLRRRICAGTGVPEIGNLICQVRRPFVLCDQLRRMGFLVMCRRHLIIRQRLMVFLVACRLHRMFLLLDRLLMLVKGPFLTMLSVAHHLSVAILLDWP